MKNLNRLACLLACASMVAPNPALSEDVQLRAKAVAIMNRSLAVSLPGALGKYREEIKFTVHQPDGAIQEGTFSRQVAGNEGSREEAAFENYHSIRVVVGNRLSETHTADEPPEIREVRRQLPVHLGRFDHEDVIQSVLDTNVLGRPAQCINFQSRFGDTMQSNQICMDTERGAVLHWQVGEEVIENTEYFQVGQLWEPGRIRRLVGGRLQLEIEQQITLANDLDASTFVPPNPNWQTMTECKNMRQAVGVSTPMPPAGNQGVQIVDVIVRAYIWDDGSVRGPAIESSPRPDLNDEALKLVSSWKFAPLLCNDQAAVTVGEFTVHFQGR
jgi:hypothetical protein